jgi:Polysaccharide lyase
MGRVFQTGYETGDVGAVGAAIVAGTGVLAPTVVAATPVPRTGSSYCLKCAVANNDPGDKSVQRYAHAAKTELWYSFGFYVANATEQASEYVAVLRNFDSSGNTNIVVRVDAGTVRVYRASAGGAQQTPAQLTLLGSASSLVAQTTWVLCEIRFVAATGATGTVEVWLGGVQVLNATGVATCQTGAHTTEFETGYYRFGGAANLSQVGAFAAFDDLRLNDTAGSVNNGRPGDESIRLLVPTSAGDLTQWTPSAGSNHQCVDETPPSASDYVHGSTVGQTDLYGTLDFPVSAISAVQLVVQATNADGAGGTINLVSKTGAGQSDGSAQSLSASFAYLTRLLETDPADAAPWTSAKLAALQIGVKVAS